MVFTMVTFPLRVKCCRFHSLSMLSHLFSYRAMQKLSSCILCTSLQKYIPRHFIAVFGHFKPRVLCLKFELAPIAIASLLSLFTLSPEHLANLSSISNTILSESMFDTYMQVSSAYCDILHTFLPILIPIICGFCLMAEAIASTIITKRFADRGHP